MSNLRKVRAELRTAVIDMYGNECIKCGYSDPRALQIDHVTAAGVYNKSGSHKKGMNPISYMKHLMKSESVTSGLYQILCANCNWIKRYEHGEAA